MQNNQSFYSLLLLLLILFFGVNCQINLSTCNDLLSVKLNNSTVVYQLLNDIDCLGTPYSPIGNSSSNYFQGKLNGNGKSIKNVFINSISDYVGIFGYASGANLNNLNLYNITVFSTGQYVASLIGYAFNTNITNVNLDHLTSYNNITTSNQTAGGLVGNAFGCSFFNITVKNTFVSSATIMAGGITGVISSTTFDSCFYFGITSLPNAITVTSQSYSGGIGGFCSSCSIKKSGVISGKLVATSFSVGAIFGTYFSSNSFMDQVYSLSNVTLIGEYAGGISGFSFIDRALLFENLYSKANVSGSYNVGGLFGNIIYSSNTSFLTLRNSYSASILTNTTTDISSFGNIVGILTNLSGIIPSFFAFENVYYLNTSNPSISVAIGSKSDRITVNSSATGYSTQSEMNSAINSTFNQCTIWDGDHLRIENGYIPGPPIGCTTTLLPTSTATFTMIPSTTPPSTITPSTTTPSTTPPSTTPPSTITPSTITPSTITPSTIPPSTIPPTTPPSTITPSTITPSTITPSTTPPSTTPPSTTPPSTIPPSTTPPSTTPPSTTPSPTIKPKSSSSSIYPTTFIFIILLLQIFFY